VSKPIQIEGTNYFVNLVVERGSTHTANASLVIELYTHAPTGSAEPAHRIQVTGDTTTLFEQFERGLELLNLTRTW